MGSGSGMKRTNGMTCVTAKFCIFAALFLVLYLFVGDTKRKRLLMSSKPSHTGIYLQTLTLFRIRCYAHYRLCRLHPLAGKSYCRPMVLIKIQAGLNRCEEQR